MIVTLELVFETAKRIKLFVCAVCLCCEVCGACTCMHVEQKLNNVMIPEKTFCSREMCMMWLISLQNTNPNVRKSDAVDRENGLQICFIRFLQSGVELKCHCA